MNRIRTPTGEGGKKSVRRQSPPSIAIADERSVRTVIADGRRVFAAALKALLELEPGIDVVHTCSCCVDAVNAVRSLEPDVLLVDLNTPPGRSFALIRELRKEKTNVRIVVIADEIGEDDTMEALRLGVHGIVLSTMPPNLLAQCIRNVALGKQWIEKVAMGRALDTMLRRQEAERVASVDLTPREIQVIRLVTDGLRNKDIAEKLHLGEGTVKVYLNTIYRKLEVSGRVELTRHAQKCNLI